MSVVLTVGNETFDYPQNQEPRGWGEDATAWAVAVTDLIANLQGPDDISQTSFAIANNISSPTNVSGLFFSTSTVRSAIVQYAIIRGSTAESGNIHVVYNGSTWELARQGVGDAGVSFTITSGGQFQYTSTNATTGNLKFRAQTLLI